VEDFKSQQAVFRNSRAIASQMLAEMWSNPAVDVSDADAELFEVERALLDFVGRRDTASAERLEGVLEMASARGSPMTETDQWASLVAHARTMIEYAERLLEI